MANYGGTSGVFGDPLSPGWEDQNLVTITAPNGESWRVNKKGAPAFQAFLNDLAATGYVPKSSGGFNYRKKRGGTSLSEHAYGNAIDINALSNAMGSSATDMPGNVAELAAKHGLEWGGTWKNPDPMHFEWMGDGTTSPQPTQSGGAKPMIPEMLASGGNPFLAGGSGGDQLAPERQSVIKQLLGGDAKGAWGTFKGNLTGEGLTPQEQLANYGRRAERMQGIANSMQSAMQSTNAPVSWTQVLAGALGTAGAQRSEGKAAEAQSAMQQQLQDLLSTGNLDPETVAKISILNPELGQQLQLGNIEYGRQQERDQRLYGQNQQLQDDQQAHAVELEKMRTANELMLSKMGTENRTALMQEVEAAGFKPGTPEYEQAIQQKLELGQYAKAADGSGMSISIGPDGTIHYERSGIGTGGTTTDTGTDAAAAGAPAVDGILKHSTPDSGQVRLATDGQIVDATVPGSTLETEQKAAAAAAAKAEAGKTAGANSVLRSLDQAEQDYITSPLTGGLVGNVMANIPLLPSAEKDARAALNTATSHLGFDELRKMREESPTGAAVGNLTQMELQFLQSMTANLDASGQSKERLLENIRYVKDIYKKVSDGDFSIYTDDQIAAINEERVQKGMTPIDPKTKTVGGAVATPTPPPAAAAATPGAKPVSAAIEIGSQAEYDALPDGAEYTHNGVTYRKGDR
jgi:D-alanyl-D-alanine carboxypeptidase